MAGQPSNTPRLIPNFVRSGDSTSRGGGTNWKHSSSTSNEYIYICMYVRILWYRMGCHNPMNNPIEKNRVCCLTIHIISNINSLPNIISLHPKCVHELALDYFPHIHNIHSDKRTTLYTWVLGQNPRRGHQREGVRLISGLIMTNSRVIGLHTNNWSNFRETLYL